MALNFGAMAGIGNTGMPYAQAGGLPGGQMGQQQGLGQMNPQQMMQMLLGMIMGLIMGMEEQQQAHQGQQPQQGQGPHHCHHQQYEPPPQEPLPYNSNFGQQPLVPQQQPQQPQAGLQFAMAFSLGGQGLGNLLG
jgi:hypothetical protein